MKKIKLLSVLLVLLLADVSLSGQKIFRDGYIEKADGETFSGLVRYASNQGIPSKCTFKRFDIAREVVYSPLDIKAFGYKNGNRYESKNYKGTTSFYEVLVSGTINLYIKGSKYYIAKGKGDFTELKNGHIDYIAGNESKEFRTLQDFLCYITEKPSGSLSGKFNLKKDLLPLITIYDKETGEEYQVYNRHLSEKQLAQRMFETGTNRNTAGIIGGLTYMKLNIKPNPQFTDFIPEPVTSNAAAFGIGFEHLLFRRTDRLSVKVELLYSKLNFYGYSEKQMTDGFARNDVYVDFTGVKVPAMIQYSVTGKRLVPFINAGIAMEVITGKSYLHSEELETLSNAVITNNDTDMGLKSSLITGLAGLGFRTRIFNNLGLQVQGRAEYGPGILFRTSDKLNNGKKPFTQNTLQASILVGITF
ncbi:MAG TPA: hypothetical protein VJ963_11345 [Bacteroidales bacterium]|nr:hypothetical protein [Bacteroidales bacterium]